MFDAIVKSAARLFDPCMISIVSLEGHQLIYRASASARYEQNIETFQSLYPMPFDPERRPASRAILEKRIVEIPDAAAPDVSESMRNAQKAVGTFRSLTLVPLIREGQGIGIISLAHPEPGFKLSHKQLALVQTFADQAVIAIENTRLFEAAQARTHELTERTQELTETLEYQTAVSEVLGVISRSPNQLQPVLDTIVQTAQRLCQSDRAQFFRLENGKYHLAAQRGTNPEFLRHLAENPISPEPGSGTTTSKAAREHRTIHVPDVLTDSEFAHGDRAGRGRSILAVPLIRDDVVIGVITVAQDAVRPFSDREIKLVETFAKQALIAIENTRLFEAEQVSKHKLQESLEYQTATSEVLKTISRSTFDLRAVLDTLISSAIRLCQAEEALIWTLTDNTFRLAAKKGIRPECEKFALEHPPKVDRSSISGRAVLEGRTIHIPDVLADSEYQWRGAQAQEVGKFRSLLCVPLLREKIAFGTTVLSRNTVQPFSDKQIELVSTFADQALIAIENTRLFEAEQASKRELQESLEYQTANSDVLAVISRSPNELQPVLDAIVQTALSLCPSDRALVMLPQVDGYRVVARAGSTPKQKQTQGLMPVDRGSVFGRVALEGRTIHVEDVRSDPDYTLPVDDRRTVLGVPLLRDGNIAGVILLLRTRSSLSANARSSS